MSEQANATRVMARVKPGCGYEARVRVTKLLTDRALEENWLTAEGGLGVRCCFPSLFCRAGIGGDGSL